MLIFQRVDKITDDHWGVLLPLISAHHAEVSHAPEVEVSVSRELYNAYLGAGTLKMFGAFDGDRIVGYATFTHYAHPHTGVITAISDSIYLAPEYRGINGVRFMEHIESELTVSGAEALFYHAKANSALGPMLDRMGFKPVDIVYYKRVQ